MSPRAEDRLGGRAPGRRRQAGRPVVHPAPGHPRPVAGRGARRHPRRAGRTRSARGIVHRLDKDTSGLLVVAAVEDAHRALQAQIRRREVERVYLALVDGRPPVADRGRSTRRSGARRATSPDGRRRRRRRARRVTALRGRRAAAPRGAARGPAGDRTHPPDPGPSARDRTARSSATRSYGGGSAPLRARAPVPARPADWPSPTRSAARSWTFELGAARGPGRALESARVELDLAHLYKSVALRRDRGPLPGGCLVGIARLRSEPGSHQNKGNNDDTLPEAGIKELLEAGVHFGHQTRRWNPKMRRYIFGERDGIHIIDLLQTEELLEQGARLRRRRRPTAAAPCCSSAPRSRPATRRGLGRACGMPYVNHRWLGGLLTNFRRSRSASSACTSSTALRAEGQLDAAADAERMARPGRARRSSSPTSAASSDMQRPPDAIFVIDLKTEAIAVREAQRLRHPDHRPRRHQLRPRPIDYVIPGNDDAIRSCELIDRARSASAILAIGQRLAPGGRGAERNEEEGARRKKREEEQRKKREEEEKRARRPRPQAAAEAEAAAAGCGRRAAPAAAGQARRRLSRRPQPLPGAGSRGRPPPPPTRHRGRVTSERDRDQGS